MKQISIRNKSNKKSSYSIVEYEG